MFHWYCKMTTKIKHILTKTFHSHLGGNSLVIPHLGNAYLWLNKQNYLKEKCYLYIIERGKEGKKSVRLSL